MNTHTTPAQQAYDAYIKALPSLSEWRCAEKSRREHCQLDSDHHLISGLMIVMRVGNMVRAAMEAEGQTEAQQQRLEVSLWMVGDEFDRLMERYHIVHSRCGKFVSAC